MSENATVVGLVVPTRNASQADAPAEPENSTHSPSQQYLSTRGGDYGLSFEEVVLKGLASDGGLFIPEEIPSLPDDWKSKWKSLSFSQLAYEVFSLYVSMKEIPSADLKEIINRSYSTFRAPEITPLVTLIESDNLYLLELFHGPTFAFEDVALQFLGNLFEYFLIRRNKGKTGVDRFHLTVIDTASGDAESAAICGLRGKKDVSVFILHPNGRGSSVPEARMTTILDANVHNLAIEGTFDDCQDTVKELFADSQINSKLNLAAVNSVNIARILAQTTYYFYAYFSLAKNLSFKESNLVRFVAPNENFGDILAGYFAKRMGLPMAKLVVATNENDVLDRFWKTGYYEKKAAHGVDSQGELATDGVKEYEDGFMGTLNPAIDISVSSFERLLWFLAYEFAAAAGMNDEWTKRQAGQEVEALLKKLKLKGGFGVYDAILEAAKRDFEVEMVSKKQTIETIREFYRPSSSRKGGYILDPHSAVGVTAALRSMKRTTATETHHIALVMAHPAKFENALDLALKDEKAFSFQTILPEELVGLDKREKRVREVSKEAGWQGIREIIEEEVKEELAGARQ